MMLYNARAPKNLISHGSHHYTILHKVYEDETGALFTDVHSTLNDRTDSGTNSEYESCPRLHSRRSISIVLLCICTWLLLSRIDLCYPSNPISYRTIFHVILSFWFSRCLVLGCEDTRAVPRTNTLAIEMSESEPWLFIVVWSNKLPHAFAEYKFRVQDSLNSRNSMLQPFRLIWTLLRTVNFDYFRFPGMGFLEFGSIFMRGNPR